MRQRPPLFPLMPALPLAALAATAAASIATWRRLRRLEAELLPDAHWRSARQVLDDHLALAMSGDLDSDLARNYDRDVVLLTSFGTYRGHDGVRTLARRMNDLARDASFDYHDVMLDGDVGFLRWSGTGSDGTRLVDGADSYVIRGGRIVAQTIHYRTEPSA